MNPIIRQRRRATEVPAIPAREVETAEERLRVLIHEMSNLLDGSMRSLALVQREMDGDESAARVRVPEFPLSQLERVAASLEQMADLLRSATGQASGPPRIRSASRTVLDLLDHVTGFIALSAEDRGIRVVTSVSGDAGGLSAPPIESALLNVLRNGIEAIGRGGRIDVLASVDEDAEGVGWLVVTVLDDGCGPPRTHPDRVFEAGYTTRPDGTGIGLALSRRIVEELGGTITLRARWESSSLGSDSQRCGARVEIRLPL